MQASTAALDVRPLSRFLKTLGDETRLRMLALLSHGELCVCHLEGALGLSQPTASRHLGVLRAAGVVDHERRGTWVYYRLAAQPDPDCARLMRTLIANFARRQTLERDVARLRKRKGPCR